MSQARASARGDRLRSAAPSAFADGQPRWHFLLDGGALTVLLGLGVLGFSLSFGGDPYYLVAGFGGIILGLAIAACNAHFRLGLLITTALALGAYLVLGTALAVPGRRDRRLPPEPGIAADPAPRRGLRLEGHAHRRRPRGHGRRRADRPLPEFAPHGGGCRAC